MVQLAAVCRSWRSLLRSKACWAGIPLHVSLTKEIWDQETLTLKKSTDAIVDDIRCLLSCGLLHATHLAIGLKDRDEYPVKYFETAGPVKEENALYNIVSSLFRSFNTACLAPLTIESLKLTNIRPRRELREALAPHCQHTKVLHFTYPRTCSSNDLPSLRDTLEACPSLEDIHLGWGSFYGSVGSEILTPFTEIAAFAQSRLRPYRCVCQDPSHPFFSGHIDEAQLIGLLPWLGSIHFDMSSRLDTPFAVAVPSVHCHLEFSGGPSTDSLQALSHHLHQCQATYHAIKKVGELPCFMLHSVLSTPSVRELHLPLITDRLRLSLHPNILRFRHDHWMSMDDLETVSFACPNLCCLSVFVVSSSTEAFPSFPSLVHLRLGEDARGGALARHIASTSPKLATLTLHLDRAEFATVKGHLCPAVFDQSQHPPL